MLKISSENNRLKSPLLGIGLYTIGDAAAYTGIAARDIQRWLFGYESNGAHHAGLWQSALNGIVETKALGFHDLLEIRFVNAFRQYGVSLQAIRHASHHARELFNHSYPFTCKQFQTDGRSIFAEVLEETSDETLLDLVKKQYVFKQVIKPSLYEGIDYSEMGDATRWYPIKRNRMIVLDPSRHFGKPILTDAGIATETLLAAYKAEGENSKRVAQIYEIPVAEVDAAIQFEHRNVA